MPKCQMNSVLMQVFLEPLVVELVVAVCNHKGGKRVCIHCKKGELTFDSF